MAQQNGAVAQQMGLFQIRGKKGFHHRGHGEHRERQRKKKKELWNSTLAAGGMAEGRDCDATG
jgi:hypothetical protein